MNRWWVWETVGRPWSNSWTHPDMIVKSRATFGVRVCG